MGRAFRGQATTKLGVLREFDDAARDIGGRGRIDEQRFPGGDFLRCSRRAGQDRRRAGHGFDDRQAEALVKRGKQERLGAGEQRRHVLLCDEAKRNDSRRWSDVVRLAENMRPVEAAGDDEKQVIRQAWQGLGPRAQRADKILAAVGRRLQEEVTPREIESRPRLSDAFWRLRSEML